MKILIVSKCPTHPTTAGNRWAVLAQANTLASLGNDIHFLYIDERGLRNPNSGDKETSCQATKEYWGVKFHYLQISKAEKFLKNIVLNFRRKCNRSYVKCDDSYPWHLTSFVHKLQEEHHFDACIVNYYYLTKLFNKTDFAKKALHTHDCMAYRDIMVGEKCISLTANEEAKAMQRSPYIFALQDEEAAYFQLLSPRSKIFNIYSKYEYLPQPTADNHNIVFLSGGNSFNVNGLKWFISEIFPAILVRFPDTQLVVGGSICDRLGKKGQGGWINNPDITSQVVLYGYVDNPADFYALADVAINPVYQGTGLKIKTFEAISYDKVTMVHPHSMKGVFEKSIAPLFVSDEAKAWIDFLEQAWEKPGFITAWKEHNKAYMERLGKFVENEYKRFINEWI